MERPDMCWPGELNVGTDRPRTCWQLFEDVGESSLRRLARGTELSEPSRAELFAVGAGETTLREKRILVTWLYGDAWEALQQPQYRRFRVQSWALTSLGDGTGIGEGEKYAYEFDDHAYATTNIQWRSRG